jgi:hypothetical protein
LPWGAVGAVNVYRSLRLPDPSETAVSKPAVPVPSPVTIDPSGRTTAMSYDTFGSYPVPDIVTRSPGEYTW